MADRLCKYCQDEGGSCCGEFCYKRGIWWLGRCEHYECWIENGRKGFPDKSWPVEAEGDS